MISINNISFAYKDKKVFDNFSLNISDGEFVSVIGKNGSGKSTLVKLFNGLLIPKSGDIIVNGIKTSDSEKIFDLRRSISVVFQNPDNQLVSAVVEDEIAFGAENIGLPPEEIKSRVDRLLQDFGLSHKIGTSVAHLSGGEKQRLAIASSLITKPDIIVFDEADSMLDPESKRDFTEIVKKLNLSGMTVIMITQDMEEALTANRCIVIGNGTVVLDSTPENVFSNEELLNSFSLTVPDIMKLKSELIRKGIPVPDTVKSVEVLADALCDYRRIKKYDRI